MGGVLRYIHHGLSIGRPTCTSTKSTDPEETHTSVDSESRASEDPEK